MPGYILGGNTAEGPLIAINTVWDLTSERKKCKTQQPNKYQWFYLMYFAFTCCSSSTFRNYVVYFLEPTSSSSLWVNSMILTVFSNLKGLRLHMRRSWGKWRCSRCCPRTPEPMCPRVTRGHRTSALELPELLWKTGEPPQRHKVWEGLVQPQFIIRHYSGF